MLLPPQLLPLFRLPLLVGVAGTRSSSSRPSAGPPVDPSALLQVCTVLFQQQHSPDPRLHARLRAIPFDLSHEFFLQVCCRFPSSWRPVLRLFRYAEQHPAFSVTPVAVNKMVDVFGRAKNIDLLWDFLGETTRAGAVNARTLRLAVRALAEARQIKKCVAAFHLLGASDESLLTVGALNSVVAELCARRLADEAADIVSKLKASIAPNGTTYSLLVMGLCRTGDAVSTSKVWNKMVDAGFEPDAGACNEMIERFFKSNRWGEAMAMFRCLRSDQLCKMELPSYRIVLTWLCKGGDVEGSLMLFAEMTKRGVMVDGATMGALVYGLVCKGRVNEGYRALEGAGFAPDVRVYHGLIGGLLRLRRAREATQVLREMSQRGVRPGMHTYIMLLQGHLGRRGRKARDPEVNFESIFVGGLVKMGRMVDVAKYVERTMPGRVKVPRFDYNKFLRDFSNKEGVVMFEQVGRKLKEKGLVDLGDIFLSYGENMATRERRRKRLLNLAPSHDGAICNLQVNPGWSSAMEDEGKVTVRE